MEGVSSASISSFSHRDNWPSVLYGVAGGVVLSIGKLSTQYAWALVGLSVTEVVSANRTVIIGATLNYFLDDRNRAQILFHGVGCFFFAVSLGSAVHSSNIADDEAKLNNLSNDCKYGVKLINISSGKEINRGKKVFGKSTFIGLAITFFPGLCFSLFSPLFNLATKDQWHALKEGVPHLTLYTSFFYFSASSFVIVVVLNITFLYKPILSLPKSSLKAYLGDWDGKGWPLLAGLLCGLGNGLQLMGGQAAGYAAAIAVLALPLVSTFWGFVMFEEFNKSSGRTYTLLGRCCLCL